MTRCWQKNKMTHLFVDIIPNEIDDNVLYVSMKYGTAIHKCACGCGNKVVTPFDEEKGWVLSFNGKTVSLTPSVGNWNLACKSHYWIKDGRVLWVPQYSFKLGSSNKKKKKGMKQWLRNIVPRG